MFNENSLYGTVNKRGSSVTGIKRNRFTRQCQVM